MIMGQDYIGVGVGAIVFNEASQVFLAQRGPETRNEHGHWEFPGGGVDFGEKLETAIVREFAEEYAMEITVVELLDVHDHILPEENQHWVSTTYIARHVGGEPKILEPEKCTAIGWFELDNLPKPLSQVSVADIKAYWAKTQRG